ncbi:hypothetical protein GGH96_000256 [Coemansia sp. RSA 1972]|nr:hypothetical protein GGH96_000256 [Coemansia sp. RSA 1972]
MEHVEFYKRFPLLVPETLDPLKADGYIETSEGERVRITIDASTTHGTYCVDIVKSTLEVEQILQSKKAELDARFQQCASGLSFVKELQHSLSFDKKTQIMTDASGREHSVYVDLSSDVFSSNVEENSVSMEGTKLTRYLETLEQRCEQLKECWDLLDDIDSTLCVLQPRHPKRHELWRRIAVTDLATALIDVSPDRSFPKITVYGPRSITIPLNTKAKNVRTLWSTSQPARQNIESILQCTLPHALFDHDIKLECGVCFAFTSDGETADQVCANDVCAQPFHRKCLVQWLTAKEDTHFWFEFASPYSMISALRLLRALTGRTNPFVDTGLPSCQLPDLTDIDIVYRPILLPAVFAASGLKMLPGVQVPAKGKYMFHDVQRTLRLLGCLGFPDRPHTNWPPNTVLAGRMAWMLAQGPSYVCALDRNTAPSTNKLEQGPLKVLAEFVWRVFEAEFIGGEDIGSPKVLERLWNVYVAKADLGCEMPSGERAVELASMDAVKDGYKGNTQEAIACKLFGAPSFTTDGDMYWGNDHLLEACVHHKVRNLLGQPGYCTKSALPNI